MTEAQILLQAHYACRFCLRAPTTIRVSGTPTRRVATVDCAHCNARTEHDLSADDAARLWELNRVVSYVHFASDAI